MFIVNTWRRQGWGEGWGETGVSEFPRLEIVNTLFYSGPCLQSSYTLYCTEARRQSYQTFVCISLYLINASSLSLFLLPRLFPGSLLAPLVSLLLFLSPCLSKLERSHLLDTGAWGRKRNRGAFRPIRGFARAGLWSHSLLILCQLLSDGDFSPFCDPRFY